jgi:rhamnosyltransferase
MNSSTAVIKVLFEVSEINYDEVVHLTSVFKYFVVVNNSSVELSNPFNEIPNFEVYNNYNRGGLSGAYNMALAGLNKYNPEFILFLDDDTSYIQLLKLFDAKFYSNFNNPFIAAVSPMYIDSKSKTKGSHFLLKKYSFSRIPRDYIGISSVSFMINSCSVWRHECIKKIGKYDENLKVDHIDTDFCLRAIKHGYSLILDSNYVFMHTIGNRISYNIFNKKYRSGNHSSKRREMIMKNSILVFRKHAKAFPILSYIILERVIYEFIGIIIAENNKLEKIKMSLKGLYLGITSGKKSF